jgi:glycosyltransferase involved in cell wall biosynthesis
MSILYLLTAPPPPIEGTDAVYQEVDTLKRNFPGIAVSLTPVKTPTNRFPKQLFGFHKIREIQRLEKRCCITHVFFGSAYAFPVLQLLRNPVIYTITGTLDQQTRPRACGQLRRLRKIVVSSRRDAAVLDAWGLTNYAVISPGVDLSAFKPTILPVGRELTLLMASAPWNMRQFGSKGIDLLLAALTELPFLRLILLWRGVLAEEIVSRVRRLNLTNRVEVINHRANVAQHIQRAHAAVLLCENGALVKAYPHSLIEALAAGKPVLLSNTIAMADFVNDRKCGVVIQQMTIQDLAAGLNLLKSSYEELCRNAIAIGPDTFSIDNMLSNYRRIYGI